MVDESMIGEKVFAVDAYGNHVKGILEDIREAFTFIKKERNHYVFRLNNTYGSYGELAASIKEKTNKYCNEIKTVNDLVRFMYTHTCCPCEEYTDWEAREAAAIKAIEFGIELEEDK